MKVVKKLLLWALMIDVKKIKEYGVSMKDVQKRLRHENIKITMDNFVKKTKKQRPSIKIFEECRKHNLVNS